MKLANPIIKSLLIGSMVLITVSANVFANNPTPNATKADPAKGEALYTNGDATRNIVACVACHGASGNATIAQNPKLSGQHGAYLVKQLHEFAKGTRNNAIMTEYAKALSEEDMQNIAAYLSKQAPKPGAAKNKATLDFGKKVFRAGITEKNVPACAGCHGPAGGGIPAQYPRIAGQNQDYTITQLTNFRSDARANNPAMSAIAKRMSDEDIKAVADYIAGLK